MARPNRRRKTGNKEDIRMTYIEIDLRDYEDEIKNTFCENNNCLLNLCRKTFKERFRQYINDLNQDIYVYNKQRDTETILRELTDLYLKLL